MKVILTESIKGLGVLGDTVAVKRGYYRNHLGPSGKALLLTKENIGVFEERKVELEEAEKDRLVVARSKMVHVAAKIEFNVRASDEGKLFGSITATEIAEQLTSEELKIERRNVELKEGSIRNVGIYNARVFLHPEVAVDVEVFVEAPNAPLSKFMQAEEDKKQGKKIESEVEPEEESSVVAEDSTDKSVEQVVGAAEGVSEDVAAAGSTDKK